jgi:hypothetical protein
MKTTTARLLLTALSVLVLAGSIAAEVVIDEAELRRWISEDKRDAIEGLGPQVMPLLAEIYRSSEPQERAGIAAIFYQFGWQSEEAKAALLEDIDTTDERLAIRVEYALGRVSNDDAVVEALLDNLETGASPLIRDKAGCGLAYDQIHLTEEQKVNLYFRLIELLPSQNPETRSLAIRVLQVHTGQTKGYLPLLPAPQLNAAIMRWRKWLEEYADNI